MWENMQLYKQKRKKRENGIEIKEIIINFVFGICHAESPERGNKRVGSDFYKQGVYLTLVFQTVNFAPLQITEDKMATQMPTVGILYTLPWFVVYIRLVLATGTCVYGFPRMGLYSINYAWAFCSCTLKDDISYLLPT